MKTIDEMIKMVECCYFTGACKLCPYYKAPKFGAIGKCEGMRKVGNDLIDLLCFIKANSMKEQPDLFTGTEQEPEPTADQAMIPPEAFQDLIGEKLWMEEESTENCFAEICRGYKPDSDYISLYLPGRDIEIVRKMEQYGIAWRLYREAPEMGVS